MGLSQKAGWSHGSMTENMQTSSTFDRNTRKSHGPLTVWTHLQRSVGSTLDQFIQKFVAETRYTIINPVVAGRDQHVSMHPLSRPSTSYSNVATIRTGPLLTWTKFISSVDYGQDSNWSVSNLRIRWAHGAKLK